MKGQLSRLLGLAEKEKKEEVHQLAITRIVPNRYQPRSVFDDEKIVELSQTIKTHGVIQPIVVREIEEGYELIAGERRWRACQLLEYETIPAIIHNLNDVQAASVALIENLQREGLTSIEEASAYQQLIDLHNLTQESLAQRLGKGQSTIANKIRLLQLPEECHHALRERLISERHARALLALPDADQQRHFLELVIEQQLNVKQTEDRIKAVLEKPRKKRTRRVASYSKDTRIALNTIRESVDMVAKSGMQIETAEKDHEEYYEVTIKIPKK